VVQPHVEGVPLGLQPSIVRWIIQRKGREAMPSVLVEEIIDGGANLVLFVQPALNRHIVADVVAAAEAILGILVGHVAFDWPSK
jgi:hypothetical protein